MKKTINTISIIALAAIVVYWKKIQEMVKKTPFESMMYSMNNAFNIAQNMVTGKKVTSDKGVDLIKYFEGYRSTAYNDGVGVYTIGYGHTKGVKKGDTITKEKAEAYLRQDLKDAENAVNKYVKVALNQNQFDALVSFTFNLGAGNLMKSTLLKYLNASNYQKASQEFPKWVNAGGKKLQGLVTRRAKEVELFNA